MLRIHKIFTLSISGLLLAGITMAAHAQSSETFGPMTFTGSTDFTGSFLFTKFDPSLGTLNSVVITLSDSFSTQITVTNNSSSLSTGTVHTNIADILYDPSTSVDNSQQPFLTTGGIFNTQDDGNTGTQSFSVAAHTSSTLPSSGGTATNSGHAFTDGGTLTYFTGASASAEIDYQTQTNTILTTRNGNTNAGQVTTDTVSATVTYNYTPAAPTGTPEPGTWAMMVAGASTGLVALRRRRRNKK